MTTLELTMKVNIEALRDDLIAFGDECNRTVADSESTSAQRAYMLEMMPVAIKNIFAKHGYNVEMEVPPDIVKGLKR